MKVHVWDHESSLRVQLRPARSARPKRRTVAQILRAAYRKHVRDSQTRRAVKICLH